MATLQELIEKRSQLDKQIAEAREQAMKEAIARVHAIIAEFDLTADDIFPKAGARQKRRTRDSAPARYRDPMTGKTWSGRGRAPNWLLGKNRSEFEIL